MFLFVGSERSLLVDTGMDGTVGATILPYLERAGVDPDSIRYVLTSHSDFDHSAGNGALRDAAPAALFCCHELDRPLVEDVEQLIERRYREFRDDHGIDNPEETRELIRARSRHVPVDIGLRGGELVQLGDGWRLELLHVPGHTRGHLAVWDSRSRTAVIADASLADAVLTTEGAAAFPPTYRYTETYIGSTQRLAALGAETLATSHYPLKQGPRVEEFLASSLAFVDRLEETLRAELQGADGWLTARALVQRLGPKTGGWPREADQALIFPLAGHLERLLAHGRIEQSRPDRHLAWRWLR